MIAAMKRYIPIISLFLLSACGRLDSLPYNPPQTPVTWLQIQPHAEIALGAHTVIIMQPSTSAIVYLLGILAIWAGYHFWKIRAGQHSRAWWGVALALWGIGALLAGTSYEAFSYDIKCAGRDACLWTSWWEIGYLLVSVWSIDAMMLAVAQSSTVGGLRKALTVYAWANAAIYFVLVMLGVFIPLKFLISFEFLLAVAAPSILALFAINTWRYARTKSAMELSLLGAWLWLGLTIAAYFLYLISDNTAALWARGYWFS